MLGNVPFFLSSVFSDKLAIKSNGLCVFGTDIAFGSADKIPSMDVVYVTILIIIYSITYDFALVDPKIGLEVRVRGIYSAINNGYYNGAT